MRSAPAAVIVGSACGASTPATMKTSSTTVAKKSNDVPVKDLPSTTAKKQPETSTKPVVKPTKGGSFCDMANGYEDAWETAIFGSMSMDEESDPASDRLEAFMQDRCGTEFSPEFTNMNS